MAATLKIPTIFSAVDKMTSVVRTMTKSIRSFSNSSISSIKRFDQKLSGTFNKMKGISQLALGLGIGTLFREAINGNIQFNDSLASVSAITGAVGQDLINLENKAVTTAKAHKKSGAEVLKAYELVGSAKPELLKNVDALDAVTQSVIVLAKASRLDLETSATSLTGVMNQFNLTADKSGATIDALAAGAKFGAAAIPLVTESILQFGAGANSFNVSMIESVALVETFAAKGLKGADSGTKLRNILTKMSAIDALPKKAIDQLKKFGVNTDIVSDKTIPVIDRLKELSKIAGDSTALVKVFGLENKEAGGILLNNLPLLQQLTKDIGETGVANTQAAANTNTLKFALESIKTSFINTTTATNGNSKSLEIVKGVLNGVANNMGAIITVAGILIGAYLLMKGVLIASTIATTAYSIGIGVMGAISGTASIAIAGNTVAIAAYKIATILATGAQWLLNAALNANPIGLVVLAIIGLIAIIKNWGAITNWFSKIWSQFTAFIVKKWDALTSWFEKFSFADFFMNIGRSILKFMLLPLKSVLKLIQMIPGKDLKIVTTGLDFIDDLEAKIDGTGPNDVEAVEPNETKSARILNENITKNNIAIDINDPGGHVAGAVASGDVDIPINVTKTQGQN